jgi:hypothetical protein
VVEVVAVVEAVVVAGEEVVAVVDMCLPVVPQGGTREPAADKIQRVAPEADKPLWELPRGVHRNFGPCFHPTSSPEADLRCRLHSECYLHCQESVCYCPSRRRVS